MKKINILHIFLLNILLATFIWVNATSNGHIWDLFKYETNSEWYNHNTNLDTTEWYRLNGKNVLPDFGSRKIITNSWAYFWWKVGVWTTSTHQKLMINGNIGRTSHSNWYFVGSYNNVWWNSSKTNPIYTIWNNYKPSDTSLENMYGIWYTHSNFWGSSSNKPGGWGQYVAADWDIRVILEASNWRIWASWDVRAPRFYDTNSMSYYLDPASNSKLNTLNLAGRDLTFWNWAQRIYWDNSSAFYSDSNHDTVTQMIFRDKQDTQYWRVYWDWNWANFGLLDWDGSWSYLASKDNYTEFRINNSTKMRINSNGNVGIWITSPEAKLDVNWTLLIRWQRYHKNTAPTTYYQDTDHNNFIQHVNSNIMYWMYDRNDNNSWDDWNDDRIVFKWGTNSQWLMLWIWTSSPTTKLDVIWNIKASKVKTTCIWNCF
jgi:hypothetical protein